MTRGFSTHELKVASGDGRNFVLLETFSYTSLAGVTYTVPAGSKSDGASTPAALWPTLPPFGPWWLAAFLHDWGYRYSDLSEQECNALFLEAMQFLGVNTEVAGVMYQGVRLCGWKSFTADRAARGAVASS